MADINRRRMVRIAKKSEEASRADRERMATWVAAYHLNRDEFASATTGQVGNTSGNKPIPDADFPVDEIADDIADGGDDNFGGEG
jgi:hypothetical protein